MLKKLIFTAITLLSLTASSVCASSVIYSDYDTFDDAIEVFSMRLPDDEYAGMYLYVYDVSGNKVTFGMDCVTRRGSSVTSIMEEVTLPQNNYTGNFTFEDNWMSRGKGTITFHENSVTVNIETTEFAKGFRYTMDTDGDMTLPSTQNSGTTYRLLNSGSKAISIYINGAEKNFSPGAYISNGSTMVPMRAIFEELGANVSWNAETKTVTARSGSTEIRLVSGSSEAYINGRLYTLNTQVANVDGSTMIPLRFVSEALGARVNWNGEKKQVYIEK